MGDFKAAFYRGTRPGMAGVYNRLVRWIDKGQYSHCELIFTDGGAASASWMDGGVRFKEIEFDPARWDFVNLPPEKEVPALIWFKEHTGESYDLRGNIRFVFGAVSESKNKWFCSEAIAAALGLIDPWRHGPNGLAEILRDWVR